MARSGRPPIITPALASRVAALAAKGLSHGAIARSLTSQGTPIARATVQRFLSRKTPADGLPGPAEPAPEPGTPAQLEQATSAALESDDVQAIGRTVVEVEAAMRQWAEWIGTDPRATRAYAGLARLASDLRVRLVSLRPAPEAERDRLTALGEEQRRALLARAAARAEVDWRARAERAMRLAGMTP
ncbi:MAG TPA: hypothetical protein VMG12_13205 [Polyangiaceae bacterium]|nr:hypothetical protein [Polyangiaceae bacterium]